MNKHKAAILVDSGTDVPTEISEQEHVFTIPLKIIYRDAEYTDKVDITAEEIYENLSTEIPKTSLPDGETINKIFDKIKQQGYEKVLVITISSGLSGTYNAVRLLGEQYDGLELEMIDTKNIGIGAGFLAILADQWLKEDLAWATLVQKLEAQVSKDKIFFNVATLEYLQKGGRIGLVASILGNALKLAPIITCNENGVYHTVAKTRGRNKSLDKTLDLVKNFVGNHPHFNLAVAHGGALEEAKIIREKLAALLPNANKIYFGQISPALVVHTGPGLIGVGVQLLEG